MRKREERNRKFQEPKTKAYSRAVPVKYKQ